jgi:hypothetical protein
MFKMQAKFVTKIYQKSSEWNPKNWQKHEPIQPHLFTQILTKFPSSNVVRSERKEYSEITLGEAET